MTAGYHVMIVDDDQAMRKSLETLFRKSGWQTSLRANTSGVAADLVGVDAVISDMRMPGQTGLELLKALPSGHPPFLLISAHGDIPLAVEAMQAGAYSFFEKPFDPKRLVLAATHAAEQHRLTLRNAALQARLAELSGLDRVLKGRTAALAELRADVAALAGVNVPVTLVGETGTGKELVARALHDLDRPDGPFVPVDCATVADGGFATMLFGAAGYLAAAEGGTLFLDELEALPQEEQAKLLRVLETGSYTPVGSIETRPVTARIMAALKSPPGAGELRDDLAFRLDRAVLLLPPLRERSEDVVYLFTDFLRDLSAIYEIAAPDVTTADVATLMAHDWPGNIRELRHVAERRVLAARRGGGSVQTAMALDATDAEPPQGLRHAVAAFERELISKALVAHQGRMDAAAEALGIGRRTLNEKIVKLGLDKTQLF
ncbi:MAG: sigma-54 dependent transcriptional regulator [Pseudomonadota bacterium]